MAIIINILSFISSNLFQTPCRTQRLVVNFVSVTPNCVTPQTVCGIADASGTRARA